jgi:Na+-transporting NADH:ubiquinone oxidoreductase subunit NqrF
LNFGFRAIGAIERCCPKVADRSFPLLRKGKQWIKEGKRAIKWSRLSCRSFVANDMCIQMHVLAYNIRNFARTLATSDTIKDLSLTILKEKLIKARR